MKPSIIQPKRYLDQAPLGRARSLEDEKAALAKGNDRYIEAEIANDLNIEEDNDAGPVDIRDFDKNENEWSTIYALKVFEELVFHC